MKKVEAKKAVESLKLIIAHQHLIQEVGKNNYLNSQLFILLEQFSNLSSYRM